MPEPTHCERCNHTGAIPFQLGAETYHLCKDCRWSVTRDHVLRHEEVPA